MEVFLVITQIIFLATLIYFILEINKRDKEQDTKLLIKFYEEIEKIQVKYFTSLEKINKEFFKVISKDTEKDIKVSPRPITGDEIENSIEKSQDLDEVFLEETPRIPIVDGVNVKIEGDEQIYPINIEPIENYSENKAKNPIEKE